MNDKIEEYILSKKEDNVGSELFKVRNDNVDIKTELNEETVRHITSLMANDEYLRDRGIIKENQIGVFERYYIKFMRLMISNQRKGRSEYVQIHQHGDDEKTIEKLGNMSNVISARK